MSGRLVMSTYEGAALRVQLDGMINALCPLAQEAGEQGDQPVINLLAALQTAHARAVQIENRDQAAPPVQGVTLRRR